MKSINYRSRKHLLLLYPDTSDHLTCVNFVKDNYDYVYITHDKDTDDQGNILKPHIHMIIYTNNATWNTAISSILNLDLRFIQKVRNDDQVLQYLIHYNQPTKYQYDPDDLIGTERIIKRLKNIITNIDMSESEKAIKIVEYIENSDIITYTDLAKYCAINDIWDILRRNSYYFIKLIDEHNTTFTADYYKLHDTE